MDDEEALVVAEEILEGQGMDNFNGFMSQMTMNKARALLMEAAKKGYERGSRPF